MSAESSDRFAFEQALASESFQRKRAEKAESLAHDAVARTGELDRECDDLRTQLAALLNIVTRVTAELRHAYMNLTSASNSTEHTKRLADGLIAPQIRALERLVKP